MRGDEDSEQADLKSRLRSKKMYEVYLSALRRYSDLEDLWPKLACHKKLVSHFIISDSVEDVSF